MAPTDWEVAVDALTPLGLSEPAGEPPSCASSPQPASASTAAGLGWPLPATGAPFSTHDHRFVGTAAALGWPPSPLTHPEKPTAPVRSAAAKASGEEQGASVSRETVTFADADASSSPPDCPDDDAPSGPRGVAVVTGSSSTVTAGTGQPSGTAEGRIATNGHDISTLPRPPQTRVLTVANQKGGVGKTTSVVNIAAALAQAGLRVLVVDLDPQGNASTALGVSHPPGTRSVYEVLVEGRALADVVVECARLPRLLCAPSTVDLAGAEVELVTVPDRERRLSAALAAYLATAAVDYVFIDCPPSLGLLTVNALAVATEVLIPIQCEYYALEGLSALLGSIDLVRSALNPRLVVSTIVLTMYDARTRLAAQVAQEVRDHFPAQTLRTTVPRAVRVSEAPSFGETVMTYDPLSSGALAYSDVAGEIAHRARRLPAAAEERR